MPKVRRRNVPPRVLAHLLDRIHERQITADHLDLLSEWLKTDPEVPVGRWFKRFPGMFACGEGELMTTFLRIGQVPNGKEVL